MQDGRLSELARLVTARLKDISFRKNQKEVADEVEFPNRNMLSLIKSEQSKLSLDRVPLMATALEMELETIMLPALRQYYSEEVINALRETFGSTETQTEHEILVIARKKKHEHKAESLLRVESCSCRCLRKEQARWQIVAGTIFSAE